MTFQLARTNMVTQQVRAVNVFNQKILHIFEQLPIENFVLKEYAQVAYSDEELPIGENQITLKPSVAGQALQALDLQGHEKVLEIGTGTGLITACLSQLVKEVTSIEIFPSLLEKAKKELEKQHCRNVTLEQGDGVYGLSQHAPYDAILVTGSYPCGVPESLYNQLKPNGRLFAFIGVKPIMQAVLIQRKGKTNTFSIPFETSVPALINAPQPSQFKF